MLQPIECAFYGLSILEQNDDDKGRLVKKDRFKVYNRYWDTGTRVTDLALWVSKSKRKAPNVGVEPTAFRLRV